MSKGEGQKVVVKFDRALVGDASGNESAFVLSGMRYKYVGGPLINVTHVLNTVEAHPTEPNAIAITTHPQSRFNNNEGALELAYNAALGTLTGRGGPVESFQVMFTPTDLEPKPDPHDAESITVGASATTAFSKVTYAGAYAEETITVGASATVVFTAVGDLPP